MPLARPALRLLYCLQGVSYCKQDAQEAVQKLLQGNVVLVGHALHHDLHALQLDPIAVIDTSLICSYKCVKHVHACCNACFHAYCCLCCPHPAGRYIVLSVMYSLHVNAVTGVLLTLHVAMCTTSATGRHS